MAEHQRVATTVQREATFEHAAPARGAGPSNEARQRALAGGGGESVPPVDDVFWEGFAEEHVRLRADIMVVTGRAAELQPAATVASLAAALDRHIDGVFALEDALAAAITDAVAGARYGDGDALDIDIAAMEAAVGVWERLDVALDLLREHNALCEALAGADLAGKMQRLSTVAQLVVQSGMERSMAEAGAAMQKKLEAFDASWKVAALSVAKLPADIGVDLAVGAAITAGVPLILGAVGFSGTFPALAAAGTIAVGASLAWNWASTPLSADAGPLHEQIGAWNGRLDVAADAAAIDQLGEGFKASAEKVGNMSLGITVLLDLAATGVAIGGIYEAAADWEAFKKEDARLQELWGQCAVLFGGFLRLAEQTTAATARLAEEIARREHAIRKLERVYGKGLYAR